MSQKVEKGNPIKNLEESLISKRNELATRLENNNSSSADDCREELDAIDHQLRSLPMLYETTFENVNTAYEKDGSSRLLCAARHGWLDFVKILVDDIGADVNYQGDGGFEFPSPLFVASEVGHEDTVRYLLRKGADAEATFGKQDRTPLVAALLGKHENIVKCLLEDGGANPNRVFTSGSPLNYTPLMLAVGKDQVCTRMAELFLDHGAEIEKGELYHGIAPLVGACLYENFPLVQLLVQRGANVNHRCPDGRSALAIVSEKGNLPIVRFLLDHEADMSGFDAQAKNPLMYACR